MKRFFTILAVVFLTANMYAQSPEKMSYQAVVRNANNNLVTNQSVGMQINILQGSIEGTVVYTETQSPTTNANGVVSIEIGSGTVISGDFTIIDWANGPYFIKTETDPTGGKNYSITGTSQLLSVPYALHAKTAENVTGSNTTYNLLSWEDLTPITNLGFDGWTTLGNATFEKEFDNSGIEIIGGIEAWSGSFNNLVSEIWFYIQFDNQHNDVYGMLNRIKTSETKEDLPFHHVTTALPKGAHTVQIIARTVGDVDAISEGVRLDDITLILKEVK